MSEDTRTAKAPVLTVDEATALRDAGSYAEMLDICGRLRARWVAEALEEAQRRIVADCAHGDFRMGQFDPAACPFCEPKVRSVRALAAEYGDGKR